MILQREMQNIQDVLLGGVWPATQRMIPEHPDTGMGSFGGRVQRAVEGGGLAEEVPRLEGCAGKVPFVGGEIWEESEADCVGGLWGTG